MGIQGLLPLLKSISDPIHVSAYAGRRVGIDAYAWLHRGGHQCATELALHLPTDRHLQFCLSRLRLLLSHRVLPVLVFDGGRLPEKRRTEEERGQRRRRERDLGQALHAAGQTAAAFKAFQRCVSIHPTTAYQLIRLARDLSPDVECLVAPYEADAQLAFLSRTDYVSAVISEDSDLLVFGCRRVLYKMDASGHGVEVKLTNLGACTDLPLQSWTQAQFQQMCVLSGCDYLPSLPSLGLKKAHALMRQAKTWERAVKRLRLEGRIPVYDGYELDFHCALLCFQHQRVFDPIARRLTFLTDPPPDVLSAFPDLSFLGPPMADDVAGRIADGHLHPESLREFSDADMAGLYPPHATPPLRRPHSDTELVTADVDVARSATAGIVQGGVVGVGVRVRSKVESISALLVKNKIDGYFVGASEASRSGFVRPRTAKEVARGEEKEGQRPALLRAASLSAVERTEGVEADDHNPFAEFAYGNKRRRASVDPPQVEEAKADLEAAHSPTVPTGIPQEADEGAEVKVEEPPHDEAAFNDEWEDRYEEDSPDEHSQLLTHAYSMALRSIPHSSPPHSPVLLPPDSHSLHSSQPHPIASTFADPLPPEYLRSSTSPLPSRACGEEAAEMGEECLSPSPSPSPPPHPATGPVFSKYFASSSPAPSTSPRRLLCIAIVLAGAVFLTIAVLVSRLFRLPFPLHPPPSSTPASPRGAVSAVLVRRRGAGGQRQRQGERRRQPPRLPPRRGRRHRGRALTRIPPHTLPAPLLLRPQGASLAVAAEAADPRGCQEAIAATVPAVSADGVQWVEEQRRVEKEAGDARRAKGGAEREWGGGGRGGGEGRGGELLRSVPLLGGASQVAVLSADCSAASAPDVLRLHCPSVPALRWGR